MDIPMADVLPRSGIPIAAGLENVYISIAGLIGAGKTTLAKALAEVLGLPVHYEPVTDNVYLEDFYKDMKRYGFPLQIYLLNKRYRQQQQIVWEGRGGVQDRTIYEDAIFAKMLRECVLTLISPANPSPLPFFEPSWARWVRADR